MKNAEMNQEADEDIYMERRGERMNDLISRQAAIDALCKVGCGSGYCGISCDDVKAIEQLPSAQPEQQWIPVSERLPENDDEVLVTAEFKKHRFVYSASYSKDVDGDSHWYSLWDEFRVGWEREKIIAWMPMPKPYKGG